MKRYKICKTTGTTDFTLAVVYHDYEAEILVEELRRVSNTQLYFLKEENY